MVSKEGKKLYESGITEVYLGVAKKACKCAKCGRTIARGDERLAVFTSNYKQGKVFHTTDDKDCSLRTMWDYFSDTITHNNQTDTKNTMNHTLQIIAPLWEGCYFGECGYLPLPHNATHRKFTITAVNGYNTGHTISTALKNGFKCFVNGEEVATHEDFDRLTKKYY